MCREMSDLELRTGNALKLENHHLKDIAKHRTLMRDELESINQEQEATIEALRKELAEAKEVKVIVTEERSGDFMAYLTDAVEERRERPGDDVLSRIIQAGEAGVLDDAQGLQRLESDEVRDFALFLLVAGNETTRNGISGGMQLLIENPDERRKLIDDPSLLCSAVEEMVRLVSPVRSFGRTVTRDTEIRGAQLERGQQVLLLYSSANRDADVFEDPDRFRVERNPHHLGFGMGNHFCLGANLARMEMRVAFEELLRRLPDMEYAAGGPVMKPAALVRSCVEMRVRYTPERRAAPKPE